MIITSKLRALIAAGALAMGLSLIPGSQPAQAQWWGGGGYYGPGYGYGYDYGYRRHRDWGPRCRWVERRVWSRRLQRRVWRTVRVCR